MTTFEAQNKKKVLVVGAGSLQVKTIKLARALGYYCLCIDGDANAVGFKYADEFAVIDIKDIASCVDYAKNKKIDGVTTTSATITLPAVAAIAHELKLPGINPEAVDTLTNKFSIKQTLKDSGLNIFGHFADVSSTNLLNTQIDLIQYPSVVKPMDGSGSKGVVVVHNQHELPKAIEYALKGSRNNKVYVEQFIDGTEYGVECFVEYGVIHLYGIIKQTFLKDASGKIEYGHSLPSKLDKETESAVQEQVINGIKALGINFGSVNMDIILSPSNIPYIIDVGARIGLNQIAERLLPFSTGVDILSNTIRAAVRDNYSFSPKHYKPVASRLLIFRPGIIKHIEDLSGLIDGNKVLDIVITKKPGDIILPYRVKSDTCGWVITAGKTLEDAVIIANTTRDLIENKFVIS